MPSITDAWHGSDTESDSGGSDGACRVVLKLAVGTNATEEYGAPSTLWLDLDVETATAINATLTIVEKPSTRRTESASLRFAPSQYIVNQSSLQLHKVASWVAPDSVAMNGSKHIHYVSDAGIQWVRHNAKERHPHFMVRSLDAGLVAVGSDSRPVPTIFERDTVTGRNLPQPPSADVSLSDGVSVNLWNNLWQTNYVFWCVSVLFCHRMLQR